MKRCEFKRLSWEDKFDRKYACWVKNQPKAWARCKRQNRRKARRVLKKQDREALTMFDDTGYDPREDIQLPGTVVRSFKREFLSEEERKTNKHLYLVQGVAKHTETGEEFIVYSSLFLPPLMWATPIEVFMGKVDKKEYPGVKQEFLFVEHLTREQTVHMVDFEGLDMPDAK